MPGISPSLSMNMNREILRIALPNIVSNITVPLMGIVSTAIAGHWSSDTAATIGMILDEIADDVLPEPKK